MSHYLIEQLRDIDNVRVRTGVTVVGAKGEDHLEQIEVRDEATGLTEVLPTSWLFIFIGAAPLTDWLDGVVARDARGFVLAGPDLLVDGRRPLGLGAGARSVAPWRPTFPASSSPATCAPIRSSEWPRPSARVRWPSPWCTATWRGCDADGRA